MRADAAAERVRRFSTSIFSEISALALEVGAVNLGQGFPDFPGPAWVKQAAVTAIDADHNQYAPSIGVPALREAVARHWHLSSGLTADPQREITVVSGATEGLFAVMQALLNPGDGVVLFEPFYDAYLPDLTMAGAVARTVRLHPPQDGQSSWQFAADDFAAACAAAGSKLILLNTPHNPTGKVFSAAELQLIAECAQRHDLLVVADEVYDQLTYGSTRHQSIAALPGMADRTLTINSIGKTFSLTGWKIGWVIAPAALTTLVRHAHQWITFATATPLQHAAAFALDQAAAHDYYRTLRAEYSARESHLRSVLQEVGLTPLATEGSYFIMSKLPDGFTDDAAFCRFLAREVGVAAIPPSAFYADQTQLPALVRFCFAKRDETLAAAAARLRGWAAGKHHA
jgi:aspartate/methionine/tyrosine aminotransferase